MMGVTTGGDITHAFAILEDGLVIADIDVIGVDDHRHQLDGGLRITLGERSLALGDEVGQLFRDISLAILISNLLSMVVSITVTPCACAFLLKAPKVKAAAGAA